MGHLRLGLLNAPSTDSQQPRTGPDGGVMTEADEVRAAPMYSVGPDEVAKMPEDLQRRWQELIVFRDAGVLTDPELEEQMLKLRWRLP
jgi:hypothetical protein